jgi:hypothetical protein
MTDPTPTLSPEAQQELTNLESSTIADGGDWLSNYMGMLKRLAQRNTTDVTEWEIKGQGIEALEKSREDHRIAVELKAYAQTQIPIDYSATLAKLPELASLDEFLKRAWRDTGRDVLRGRFMDFLTGEAEVGVDEQMSLHPRHGVSREDYVKQMAAALFCMFDEDGMAAPTQLDYRQRFRAWWKHHEGNNLSGYNEKTGLNKTDRHKELIKLLPSRPNTPGITKQKWKEKAAKAGLLESPRTFRRDVKHLSDSKMIRAQEDGNFRQLPK